MRNCEKQEDLANFLKCCQDKCALTRDPLRNPDLDNACLGRMDLFPASSFLQIQAPVFWFTENLVVACIPLATSLFSRVVRAFMIAVSIRD
jgi:hypothetical protein